MIGVLSVLVVTANPEVGDVIASHVHSMGHTPRAVNFGRDAIRALTRSGCDILVLDLDIEDVSGSEVLKYKAGLPWLRSIATILMSCDDAAVETCSCLWSACVVGRLRHPLLANEVHTAIEFASRWMDEEEFGQPCGD